MKEFSKRKVWKTTVKRQDIQVSLMMNRAIWLLIICLFIIVVFFSIYFPFFKESSALMGMLILSGLILLLMLAKKTTQGMKVLNFLLEARLEMYKIVWPTKQEVINLTIVISLVVFVVSIMIYFIGLLFMHLIKMIFG